MIRNNLTNNHFDKGINSLFPTRDYNNMIVSGLVI
jgi:hypothetical protein